MEEDHSVNWDDSQEEGAWSEVSRRHASSEMETTP